MDKLFLLDAYALIYRAYYAFIKSPRINSKGFNTSAILGFVNTLEDVLKKENPTHIGVAFDPAGGSFRQEIYPEYKAQREATPEVIKESVPIIKEILKAYNIPILEVKGYEADDVIGTLSGKASTLSNVVTYMMTPDKDYGQLVNDNVFIYRPKYGDKEFEIMGINEVKNKFGISSPCQMIDLLGLMGDSSDNIPGCPGVGEKTAQKLISEYGSVENLLDHTDELKGALKTRVEENKEKIKFSKFLATIKMDVPIELNMNELVKEKPDEEKLRKIFEELEFRTLLDKIFNSEKKKSPIQASLFPEFEDNGQEENKYSNLESLESIKYNYYLVDNEEKRRDLLQILFTSKIFSLDTETTSIEAIDAELVGMSFSVKENEAYYIPIPSDFDESLAV